VNDNKWKKLIKDDKHTLIENVEQIKIKAQMLDKQVKMKEKLIHYSEKGTNPELRKDVSNMLIDSIKAKLTILDSVSKKGNK
jgi:hypothetical protein